MSKARAPVIGILTVRQGSSKIHPFAAQTKMLAGFIRYGRELGMSVYAITPDGITTKGLIGWRFNGNKWYKSAVPKPDVVYDRIPTRRFEKLKAVQRAKAHFRQSPEILYFGMDFFDKWQVHEAWAYDHRIAEHIPDTVDYRGLESIKFLLNDHPVVYVKPRSSSLGLGILRISGSADGPWRLSWRDPKGKRHDRSITSERVLLNQIAAFTRGRPYLVQQGIAMEPYRGRLYDIRAAVHRDLQGDWQVTGMGVRLGFAKSIVTNMAAGAVARPMRPILVDVARALDTTAEALSAKLHEVALAAAEVLGDAFGHGLGEIGLDLAIAQDGKIWLLEANSKPLRTIFKELKDQHMAEDCLRKPMEYAHYLAVSLSPRLEGKRGEIQ